MTKPTKWLLRPAKTQISLAIRYPLSAQRRLIRLGWSESSLGAQSICWFCHEVAQIYCSGTLCDSLVSKWSPFQNVFTTIQIRSTKETESCDGKIRLCGREQTDCKGTQPLPLGSLLTFKHVICPIPFRLKHVLCPIPCRLKLNVNWIPGTS